MGTMSYWIILFLGFYGFTNLARADLHELPSNLAQTVLSETVPFTFTPIGFTVEDFKLEWVGKALPGIELKLGRKSLEWVRAGGVFVLPRARAIVEASDIQSGQLKNNGFSQSFELSDGNGRAEIPIALLSAENNEIFITVNRAGRMEQGTVYVRFSPRTGLGAKVLQDTTCSRFSLQIEPEGMREDTWMYLGCRLVYVEGAEHSTASLELYVYWDNVGQEVLLDGVATRAQPTSVWPLRLRSRPGKVTLVSDTQKLLIRYFMPERTRLLSLGVGLGPYAYTFHGGGNSVDTILPVFFTLYGSYFMREQMRIVAFDAAALHSAFFNDFGIYLMLEQIRVMDERFSMNLLLGAHTLTYKIPSGVYMRFSAPQGLEFVFRDFLKRRHNLALGGFFYPTIRGRSYYNSWLRWGTAGLFAELNFISWREPLEDEDGSLYNRSLGVSIGFPVASFL